MMTTNPEIIHLTPEDKRYPRGVAGFFKAGRLPALSLMGNAALLNGERGIGVCGARKARDVSIRATENCITALAREHRDVVIVSGNAAGVDTAAHYTALKQNAGTIIVLPEGINHFRIKAQLKPVWSWEKTLVVSQFAPDAPWQAWRAMSRNGLILALSKAMIVVEAGVKGGTKAAGMSAIKHGTPLFVIEYQDNPRGNDALHGRQSVSTIRKSKSTRQANVTKIIDVLRAARPQPAAVQPALL